MAFDPDAYLQQSAPAPAPAAAKGFDPDAYLRSVAPPGMRAVQPGEIPTQTGYYPLPTEDVPRTFMQRAAGTFAAPLDVAATLASAAGRGMVAPAYGVLSGRGEAGVREVLAGIRQPQTPEARAVLEAMVPATAALPPIIGTGPMYLGATPPAAAIRGTVGPVAERAAAAVMKPVEPLLQARRERLSAESYARGPQIDAAKDAQRLGIALNPVDVEPGFGTRVSSAIAGPRGAELIEKANRPKVNEIARREMGLPEGTSLAGPKAFDQARAAVAAPYDKIKAIPRIEADADTRQALDALRPSETLIGGELTAGQINRRIDSALQQVDAGMSGQAFLDNISKLRKDARRIYRNKNADPAQIDLADTNLAIANTLEGMIEKSIFDPRLVTEFRAARQKMAQIYAYEGATDFNTGFVDPARIAKLTAKDNALTGDLASLGRIAGNFPDAFQMQPGAPWYKSPGKIVRSGAAGTTGGLLGFLVSGDYTGAALGSVAGATVGEIGQRLGARRIASPGYQAGLRIPDYRLPVNQLAAQATAPTQNLPAVFDPRNALVEPTDIVGYAADGTPITAEQAFSRPNWVPGRSEPQVQPSMPPQAGPALPAPSAESTMNALRAEDARRARVARQIGQEAEARTAAAEAAQRRPATGEVILELDPVTGKLREASQGIKGATPATFQNFGADLQSAAQKVSEGRRFDLTASEKVAWEKTKVDLAEVAPGFKALNDQAITAKMLDREWIAQTIDKAREKAAAFEQIAKRAKDAAARQKASANRERMLDLLDTLEEQLRSPRPVSGTAQGPKTREAIRNRLRSDSDVNNMLIKP